MTGGIYETPNGMQVHGDGAPVATPPSPLNILGTHTVELHGGGILVLDGGDNEVTITLVDADGDGGTASLNLTAAEQVQTALLNRLLHLEAKNRRR